jgi:Fur family peroxide stress response transcriptional regulator
MEGCTYMNEDEFEQRLAHFQEVCRSDGLKLTYQRIVIFEEVAKSQDHPDAETVFRGVRDRVPTVSLDTVYRTLWMLNAMGLITTVGPPREKVRFDADTSPHHHFVCSRCGAVYDVHCSNLGPIDAPDEITGVGQVESVRLELRGLCRRCAGHV